jgi:predicted PolB exonuclease-like 3'-5' exonuclease
MKIFVHTDYKGMVSLKNACEFFGIDAGKDDLDGSRVYDEYLAGNTEKIKNYCMRDADNVRKLYKVLKGEA